MVASAETHRQRYTPEESNDEFSSQPEVNPGPPDWDKQLAQPEVNTGTKDQNKVPSEPEVNFVPRDQNKQTYVCQKKIFPHWENQEHGVTKNFPEKQMQSVWKL